MFFHMSAVERNKLSAAPEGQRFPTTRGVSSKGAARRERSRSLDRRSLAAGPAQWPASCFSGLSAGGSTSRRVAVGTSEAER